MLNNDNNLKLKHIASSVNVFEYHSGNEVSVPVVFLTSTMVGGEHILSRKIMAQTDPTIQKRWLPRIYCTGASAALNINFKLTTIINNKSTTSSSMCLRQTHYKVARPTCNKTQIKHCRRCSLEIKHYFISVLLPCEAAMPARSWRL